MKREQEHRETEGQSDTSARAGRWNKNRQPPQTGSWRVEGQQAAHPCGGAEIERPTHGCHRVAGMFSESTRTRERRDQRTLRLQYLKSAEDMLRRITEVLYPRGASLAFGVNSKDRLSSVANCPAVISFSQR